ncbi:hypothetical protein RCL1_001743 [Eukaryota sp. TZLM3-RCL]
MFELVTPLTPMSQSTYSYPRIPVPSNKLWNVNGLPSWQYLKECLINEHRLHPSDVRRLLSTTSSLLRSEPNLLEIEGPLLVVGDLHGQFYDLVKLWELAGNPESVRVLFLGDYVDRGMFSTEVILFLCALKLCYPTNVYLLRGNHECRQMSSIFMFHDEVKFKYPQSGLFDDFLFLFSSFPLSAVVDSRFFCCHGGISPHISKISEINQINRFIEVPESGPMCDLLWADPSDDTSKDPSRFFTRNTSRGISYFFNYYATCKFLDENSLLSVIRGHEAQPNGYKIHKTHKKTQFPVAITIFSCPNYVDSYGNVGAFLSINKSQVNFKQFSASPHPYYLPGFLDCFSWSIPFVGETFTSLLTALLTKEIEDPELQTLSAEKKSELRTKLMALSKISSMYTNMRRQNQSAIVLGNIASPLIQGIEKNELKKKLSSFDGVCDLDRANERHPSHQI